MKVIHFYLLIAGVLLLLSFIATFYVWVKIQSLGTLEPTEVTRPLAPLPQEPEAQPAS